MNISKAGRWAAVTAVGALALTACSSNSDAGTTATGSVGGVACVNGDLKASGSTAQANAMTEWVNAYQSACSGATIEYQANGSGSGIQDFINKQTAFAGSDSALKEKDKVAADQRCATGPAIDLPTVGGAIVLSYNLPGVENLNLTPELIAGIFSNTTTKWNDPKIAAQNAGVTLPDSTIAAFHRSDSSGTTDNFTKYLAAAASKDWTFEGGKDWTAPGGQGSKGSDGIASAVKATPNSIGYLELSFAENAKLATAAVDNGAGPVAATSANAANTLATAKVSGTGNDLALSLDYTVKDPNSYPIVLVTYQIACESGNDAATLPLTKSFLKYTVSDAGQAQLTEIGYVPITGDLLTKVRSAIDTMAS